MEFGISTFVTDQSIRPAPLARAVEERGFDSLFVGEHTHIPVGTKSPYPAGGEIPGKYYRTLDPFVTLAVAASVTERILLGTAVVLISERDPIITAKEVASLDLLSNGRAVLGVGVGWNLEEMANHGTNPRTRGRPALPYIRPAPARCGRREGLGPRPFASFTPGFSGDRAGAKTHTRRST